MKKKIEKFFQFSLTFELIYVYIHILSVDFTDYCTHSVTSILHFDDDTEDDEDLLIH